MEPNRSYVRQRRATKQAENTARAYRAALNRLATGEATHPSHTGHPVRITPAAVAREARRSRNPLYTTHRDILGEIAVAAEKPGRGADFADTIAKLRVENAELRAATHKHMEQKRLLASENLLLLHRAHVAEEKLQSKSQLSANLRSVSAQDDRKD